MDIEKRLQMSFYKTIATINEEHKVYIVQNINDKHIYVKKILDIYNCDVYDSLLKKQFPGLPYIYETYQEDNTLTVIEEYISGQTLEELINNSHKFSITEIKNIAFQLCSILENMHSSTPAIIHRDIKPSNIILKNDGSVVLLDLNAAKHVSSDKTEDTTLLGTKGYAAPEQYGFGTSNPQTDIYAVGMVINTLLYGEYNPTPFPNSELTRLIEKCIQLNPKDRYKKVSILKRELEDGDFSKPKYSNTSIRKYLPPGFRNLNPINMIGSSAGYLFLFWLCLSLEVENATPKSLAIERLFCLLIFLGIVFISSNYLEIQRSIPLCNSKNKLIRLVGIILCDFIYAFAMFVLMVILSSIAA